MSIFRLTMLPASEGDCLLLTYGETEDVLRHILVDGGRRATWKHLKPILQALTDQGDELELLVLSHIDADHIDGLNKMLEDGPPIIPKAIWYNGFKQLRRLMPVGSLEEMGFAGADKYSAQLDALDWDVNADFRGNPICVENMPEAIEVAGLSLTIVSPNKAKLMTLLTEWEEWREAQDAAGTGLEPLAAELGGMEVFSKPEMPEQLDVEELSGPSSPDTTTPNGSSIAIIAEFDGRRVLLAADAHSNLLEAGLAANSGANGKCKLDLFKLSHHGSRANLSAAMLDLMDCHRFAISTDGSRFGHPDPEAIARVLKFGTEGTKTLYFNYATDRTVPWNAGNLRSEWNYSCVYPEGSNPSLTIDI